MADSFANGEAIQFASMKRNQEERGVQVRYWSDDMLNMYQETWNGVAAEEAKKDAFFAKVWADLTEFRDGYRLWQRYAFLPRERP